MMGMITIVIALYRLCTRQILPTCRAREQKRDQNESTAHQEQFEKSDVVAEVEAGGTIEFMYE